MSRKKKFFYKKKTYKEKRCSWNSYKYQNNFKYKKLFNNGDEKSLPEFDEIDKISLNQRYLIDYSNLKDGLIKNQNNFVDKKKLDFFKK